MHQLHNTQPKKYFLKLNPGRQKFKEAVQSNRNRSRRETQDKNPTFMSRMTRFLDDNVKCSFMMQHMCPTTGIGCTMCNYFAKGSCNSVCTVTDVICNANYMRCFGTKNDQCIPQKRNRHQEKDYTPRLMSIVCKSLLFCKSHFTKKKVGIVFIAVLYI